MDLLVTTLLTYRSPARSDLSVLRATLGLALGAGLRGWMVVLNDGNSIFTWQTFLALLLPATVVGGALRWAEHARRTGGTRGWRWTAFTPLLLVVAPAVV